LLNVDGFYDPLLTMMQHTVTQGFMRAENNSQLLADTSFEHLLVKMSAFTPMDSDAWLNNKY
jgi:predicted Rossmann-fold nucleotide-binding protein